MLLIVMIFLNCISLYGGGVNNTLERLCIGRQKGVKIEKRFTPVASQHAYVSIILSKKAQRLDKKRKKKEELEEQMLKGPVSISCSDDSLGRFVIVDSESDGFEDLMHEIDRIDVFSVDLLN